MIIFFVSAIVGNLAVLTAIMLGLSSAVIPTIGASAAIFGLMGSAMLVKPFEFVLYPYLIPIPLILVAVLYTLFNLASFLAVAMSLEESNVSYVAHIGGLTAGMLFGFREEKSKRGFIILLFLLLLLILTPFVWILLSYLENFNYIAVLSKFFTG